MNSKLKGLLSSNKTLLMGILNVTPDSFSDGGEFSSLESAVHRAEKMISQGADILDIGGESTRPGAASVSASEELQRVLPILQAVKKKSSFVLISTDTNKAEVAEEVLQNGADIINSLGGFDFDDNLANVISNSGCSIMLYHIQGKPRTMQHEPNYSNVVKEILEWFEKQIKIAEKFNISKSRLILDPGIGFGKTLEHNLEILRYFSEFKSLGCELAIGVSRKSHIGKLLQEELHLKELPDAHSRLDGSLAETAVAVLAGANIVRTHDVLETKKFLAVLDRIKNQEL